MRPLSRTGAAWLWLVTFYQGPVLLSSALDSQVGVGLSELESILSEK